MAVESATAVFEKPISLDPDLCDAISWMGKRSSAQVPPVRDFSIQ